MTDDDAQKLIESMCDEKYKFICYTMAEIIRKTHTNFPNVPFEVNRCPEPRDISSTKYKSDDFEKVVKKIRNQSDIQKVSVHRLYDIAKTGSKAVAVVGVGVLVSLLTPFLGTVGAATVAAGTIGAAQATDTNPIEISAKSNYMPILNGEYVKQYGLVIYEKNSLKLDKIYFLEDMLSEDTDRRPNFKIENNKLPEMIKKIAEIRNTEINKLGGTDKNHCLQNTGGVYPIYGVGTFTSQLTYDADEYYKGMYVMFVAGVYNFFEIMKYVLLKKYKNQYCEEEEHTYYEAMLRMKIQIIDICNRAFGSSVKTDSKLIKETIAEEMESAMDLDFKKSFRINYCERFQTSAGLLPGIPDWGWKAAIGVGVGAAALYGLKKWRDYKNAKTSSASSSSSSASSSSASSSPQPSTKTKKRRSSKGKKKSKRGSRRSRTETDTETSSKNGKKKKSTYKRSRKG
jgi:hypothetical protein